MDVNRLMAEFRNIWVAKAKVYVQNPELIKELIPKIKNYVLKDGLNDVKGKVLLIIEYFSDVAGGRYKGYSASSLLFLVAAMVYLISPIDFLPDLIPLLGLTDDAAVIAFVIREFGSELDKYSVWKRNL